MGKSQLARKYELVSIVDAKLTNDEKDSIFSEASDVVTKAGAKIINSQIWLERHKLTFPINKCNEGTYFLANIEADGVAVNKIRSTFRMNERILRYAVFLSE